MRFVAVGDNEVGFLAFGQLATGVIAVGQLARGCLAIGQGAIGLVAVGQGAVGLFWATGMVGVAGRKGFGGVLPLIPSIGAPRMLPSTTTLQAFASGAAGAGWLAASIGHDALGLGLFEGGQRLPVKIDRQIVSAGKALLSTPDLTPTVFAHTRAVGDRLVCDRIVFVPERSYRKKGFFLVAALQVAGLLGLGIGFWPAVGNDVFPRDRGSAAVHGPAVPPPHAPSRGPKRGR